jgi:hypothetical protein
MGGMHGMSHDMHGMSGMTETADTGLSATSDGYELKLATSRFPRNQATTLRFTITGPDGRPVTDYLVDQTKKLHLYVIRTDLSQYQHLHPTLSRSGTWSVPVRFAEPGRYHVVADFTAATSDGGATHILGAPLTVPGRSTLIPLPKPSSTTTVDGYVIKVSGALHAGSESALTAEISHQGEAVTDLQPYLGVWAHLSAFQQGSLAFTHLHPTVAPMSGMTTSSPKSLSFMADLANPGPYRVFIQFRAGGALHTGAITLVAS